MARLEEYTATPLNLLSAAAATNAAVQIIRPAPAKSTRYILKQVVLSYYGGTPATAPLVTISGGGLATPIIVTGATGVSGKVEFLIPDSCLLLAEATGYQVDVPALGAAVVAAVYLLDKVVSV